MIKKLFFSFLLQMVHLRICRIHIHSLEASPACVVMAVSLKHKCLSLAESERWASVWQSQGSRHGTSGMRCNDGVGWLTSFLGGGECRLVRDYFWPCYSGIEKGEN